MAKIKAPKDLGIKMASEEQALWETVRQSISNQIKQMEKELTVQKAFLDVAAKNAEQEKLKYEKDPSIG